MNWVLGIISFQFIQTWSSLLNTIIYKQVSKGEGTRTSWTGMSIVKVCWCCLQKNYQNWSMSVETTALPKLVRFSETQCKSGPKKQNAIWYGHVLRKKDDDRVKKCITFEVGEPDKKICPEKYGKGCEQGYGWFGHKTEMMLCIVENEGKW